MDLGRRAHLHQKQHHLGAIELDILVMAERRKDSYRSRPAELERAVSETCFEMHYVGQDREWVTRQVGVSERPPYETVAPAPQLATRDSLEVS